MPDGVKVELSELIALQRDAQPILYASEGRAPGVGMHLSRLRGRGMDFAEVRHYQAGDEIRHMEWRMTARTGKPHVKLYQEERERPVVMLVDFNSSMYFGTRVAFKSVIAARLAAILAWTVAKQGDRVGGVLFSATTHLELTPRTRNRGVLPFLAALSRYTQEMPSSFAKEAESACAFDEALVRMQRVARPGSLLVLISDFYSMNQQSDVYLNRLRQHHDVLAYHVCDVLELTAPRAGQYVVTNGASQLVLDTQVAAIRQAYDAQSAARMGALQAQLQRLQIQYARVTSATALPDLVRQTFPWRRHAAG